MTFYDLLPIQGQISIRSICNCTNLILYVEKVFHGKVFDDDMFREQLDYFLINVKSMKNGEYFRIKEKN